jgi:hypothetical protein
VKTGIDGLYVATAVLLKQTTVFAVDGRIETATFRDVEDRRPPGATAPTLPFVYAADDEGSGTGPVGAGDAARETTVGSEGEAAPLVRRGWRRGAAPPM